MKVQFEFTGVSYRTGKLVAGDLIQDKENDKCFIANGWVIDQTEDTKEFYQFDCDVLEEVNPETIQLYINADKTYCMTELG